MTRRTTLAVICVALPICVMTILVIGRDTLSPMSRLAVSAVWQTEEAFQTGDNASVIRLSIHTDKACYLPNEPVQLWIELFNLSNEPVTILKPLRIFNDNAFQGVSTLVNGHWDESLATVIEVPFPQDPLAPSAGRRAARMADASRHRSAHRGADRARPAGGGHPSAVRRGGWLAGRAADAPGRRAAPQPGHAAGGGVQVLRVN